MKKYLFFALLIFALPAISADKAKTAQEWQATTLSESTIKHIQGAKYKYMTCITKEVSKKQYYKMDTRAATDKVLKQCEQPLENIKKVFKDEKVPAHVSQRYLKQTRTKTARKVLEHMLITAAKK